MFRGLYILLTATFPFLFMVWEPVKCQYDASSSKCHQGEPTSTCSAVQLSMVRDLTLEMWVPSLRCNVAQRMHRNIPSYINQNGCY